MIDEFELLGLEQGVELARPKVDWEEGLFVVTAGQVAVLSESGEERFRCEVNDALGGIVLPAKAKVVATKPQHLFTLAPSIIANFTRIILALGATSNGFVS